MDYTLMVTEPQPQRTAFPIARTDQDRALIGAGQTADWSRGDARLE
jgi:hypothetical protein